MSGELRVVTFKVEASLLERLDAEAALRGKRRSELIREAIKQYLGLNRERRKIIVKRVILE